MKKLLCGLMLVAAFMAGAPAFANDIASHVSLAPNGRGDLLFFPVYVALDGGWETKIKVINTSTDLSTVAKVVIRSFVYSEELLDFLIYLSPTDVWTGKIVFGPNGPRLFSDDDSIQVGQNVFAGPANPVQQNITPTTCSDDSNVFGYVEVFEAWSSNIGPKPRLKYPPAGSTVSPLVTVKGAYDAFNPQNDFAPPRNILAGHYEIGNETIGVSGVQEATVLKDYDIFAKLGITTSAAGTETYIGINARNNNCEVEAALSKSDVGLYFYDSDLKFALPILTFPTKLVNNNLVGTACKCGDSSAATTVALKPGPLFGSPFFTQNSGRDDHVLGQCYAIEPGFFVYDLVETTSQNPLFSPAPSGQAELMEEEVHFIIKDYFFEEGWIEIPMDYTTTCPPRAGTAEGPPLLQYTGAPVLLTTVFLGGDGVGLMTGNWNFGDVTYATSTTAPVVFNDLPGFVHYQLDDFVNGQ